MIKKYKKKELIIYVLVFIIVQLVVLYKIDKVGSIYVIDDEFGYWGIAAWFTKHDWSGVMRHCAYYSFGYSFWLALIIKIVRDFNLAYKIAIAFNGLLLYLVFLIANKLSIRTINNIYYRTIVCVFVTFLPNHVFNAGIAWPETMLMVLVFSCVLCVSEYLQHGNGKYLIYASVIVAYSYMVHNRMIALILSFVIFLTYQMVLKKIEKRMYFCSILILSIGIVSTYCIKKYLFKILWEESNVAKGNSAGSVINALVNSVSSGGAGIMRLMLVFFGVLFYFLIATYCIYIYIAPLIKKTTSYFKQILMFLGIAFILELGLTVLMMVSTNSNSLNSIFYGRYSEIYIGSLLIIAFNILHEQVLTKKQRNILFFVTVVSLGMLSIILNKYIKEKNLYFFGDMNSIFLSPYWRNKHLYIFVAAMVSLIIGTLFVGNFGNIPRKLIFILIVICNVCISKVALNNTYFEFQKSNASIKDIADDINSLSPQGTYYILNGNNVWENRISDLIQFENPDLSIYCIKNYESSLNREFCVVVNRNTNQELNLINNGYCNIYQNGDIAVFKIKKQNYSGNQYATIYNYELGGNAVADNGEIISTNEGGHLVIIPIDLPKGDYCVRMKHYQDIKGIEEVGFAYIENEGTTTMVGNIYSDQKYTYLDFQLKGSKNEKLNIYIYEPYIVTIQSLQIKSCNK